MSLKYGLTIIKSIQLAAHLPRGIVHTKMKQIYHYLLNVMSVVTHKY